MDDFLLTFYSSHQQKRLWVLPILIWHHILTKKALLQEHRKSTWCSQIFSIMSSDTDICHLIVTNWQFQVRLSLSAMLTLFWISMPWGEQYSPLQKQAVFIRHTHVRQACRDTTKSSVSILTSHESQRCAVCLTFWGLVGKDNNNRVLFPFHVWNHLNWFWTQCSHSGLTVWDMTRGRAGSFFDVVSFWQGW